MTNAGSVSNKKTVLSSKRKIFFLVAARGRRRACPEGRCKADVLRNRRAWGEGGGRRGGEGGGRRCVCPGPLQVVRRPGRFQTYPHSKRGGLFFMVGVVRIFDPLRSKTCHNYKPLRLRAASLLALVGGVVVCLVVNPPPGTLRWGRETVYAKVRKPRTETFLKETKYMMNATNSSVFSKCWR